jgi:SAM-dependent methyltransferase
LIGANNQDFRTIPILWPDLNGAVVLDLGCGVGLYTCELARRGAVAVGVDFNLKSLAQARAEIKQGRSYFVCAEAGKLPFREGVFDMAVSVEVLSHIPPQPRTRVIKGVARILREGGHFYCTLHNRWRLTVARWLRLQGARDMYPTSNLDVWPLVPDQVAADLENCGMRPRGAARYLNYHSRFSYSSKGSHSLQSQMVIAVEDLMCRVPLLRRLGITFLLVAEKANAMGKEDGGP